MRQKKESANSKTGHLKLPSQRSKKKKRLKQGEENLRKLWDSIKQQANQHAYHESPRRREREKWAVSLFKEVIAENFPYLGKGNGIAD